MTAFTLYADKEAIEQLVSSDLGGYYVVVNVKLAPKNNEKIKVWRDDFQLKTDRDGERSKPYSPSQIAGKGALIVTPSDNGQSKTGFGDRFGRDRDGHREATAVTDGAKIRSWQRNKSKESGLMGALNEKVLPEKESDQPVSGLLFFPMEPKQKVKDLQLTYSGPGSKLLLRFH